MNNKLFWKIIFVGMAIFFAFTGATLANAVKLPNVQIPKDGHRDSLPFTVTDRGRLIVQVNIKTTGILGFAGESRFKASLHRVGVTGDLTSKEIDVRDSFETVILELNVDTCGKTGSYFVRLAILHH